MKILLLTFLLLSSTSYANTLDKRLFNLENQVKELSKTKESYISKLVTTGSVGVEINYGENFSGEYSSDITLSEVAIGIGYSLSDLVSTQVDFLYEEAGTIDIDEE